MKPLTVLLAIVLGSAVALAVSLSMTGVVFALLPEYSARLRGEHWPLLKALAWSWSLAAIAGASIVGELRVRPWRRIAQGLLLLALAALAWRYWPA
ncbi:MAG: hypothetical protein KGL25_11315 [Gammaproteobacteria bacterium]|nr:hypothetical protein [Gammaproteobacteria bacterium]MDE2251977.1 hypothetical protein [Gammaproteobacteria bacterium]